MNNSRECLRAIADMCFDVQVGEMTLEDFHANVVKRLAAVGITIADPEIYLAYTRRLWKPGSNFKFNG